MNLNLAKAAKALKDSGLSQYQDEFVYDTNVSESNYVPGVYFVLNDEINLFIRLTRCYNFA